MKKLFAVLLVVAMVLSLGVTAFAAATGGKIIIANQPANTMFRAYKIFDVDVDDDGKMTYTIAANSDWVNVVMNKSKPLEPESLITGLEFVPMDGDATTAPTVYKVNKLASFSAAKMAETLAAAALPASGEFDSTSPYDANGYLTTDPQEIAVRDDGYYLILASDLKGDHDEDAEFDPDNIKTPAALTTVFGGKDVQIQAKNDMPLDKTVDDDDSDTTYDDDGNGVELGDELNYKIESKVPTGAVNENYIFRISDTMSEGLTFQNVLTIQIGSDTYKITYLPKDLNANPIQLHDDTTQTDGNDQPILDADNNPIKPFTLVTDPDVELTGNQVRFGANGKTWELSLDVNSNDTGSFKDQAGDDIVITYSAVVNEKAVADVVGNKAVLAFGEDTDHLQIKDDSTKNYDSSIVIDKFAEGNNTQKLEGAEFVLYRRNPIEDDTDTTVDESKDAYGEQAYAKQYYVLKAKAPGADYPYGATNALTDDYIFQTVEFENGQLKMTNDQKAALYFTSSVDGKVLPKFEKLVVEWVAVSDDDVLTSTDITRVTTDINGFAEFGYLPDSTVAQNTNEDGTIDTDGYYYLYETKAPIDYARLLTPLQVVVDGSASVDPSMTAQQQEMILNNVSNVSNIPGTTLPSTGGVGATMMTIGGVALILAAGAFLVLRRRKEQE